MLVTMLNGLPYPSPTSSMLLRCNRKINIFLPSVIREAQSTESGKNLDSWILISKLRMNVIPSEINANSWNTKLWSLLDVYLNWVTLVFDSDFNSRINNRHFLDLTLKQMANLRVDGKRLLLGQLFCLDDILSTSWLYNVSSSKTLLCIYRSILRIRISFITFGNISWLKATFCNLFDYHYNQKCNIYKMKSRKNLFFELCVWD